MSEVKNVLFIVNKHAGTGYQAGVEGRILTACEKFDIECTIEFTRGRGHATELAKEGVAKKMKWVIAVGGDGTINEVARGLLHSNTPMGIIPKGSGNGLARHLGISMKMETALNQVLDGEVIVMDTFTLNDRLSLNVSGIGFDGHIANLFSASQKRGFWRYVKLVVEEYFNHKEFEAQFMLENSLSGSFKAFMIAIANASQYGNNAKVAPVASIADQTLRCAIIKKIPMQRGFPFAYQMFTGKLKPGKDYDCLAFQKGVIQVPHPVAFHVDGEPCGHSALFKIELQPLSLHMLVPSGRPGKI